MSILDQTILERHSIRKFLPLPLAGIISMRRDLGPADGKLHIGCFGIRAGK
jgi:hypothetical protein